MTLDVSIGTTTSESYASVSEADAYHVKFGNDAWALLNTAQKEVALRKAAIWIDSKSYIGVKTNSVNALEWPRYTDFDLGIYSDSIPQKIKNAQCEAALRESTSSMLEDQEDGYITEENVKGILTKYSDYSRTGKISYPFIEAMLKEYLNGGSNYHKVVK